MSLPPCTRSTWKPSGACCLCCLCGLKTSYHGLFLLACACVLQIRERYVRAGTHTQTHEHICMDCADTHTNTHTLTFLFSDSTDGTDNAPLASQKPLPLWGCCQLTSNSCSKSCSRLADSCRQRARTARTECEMPALMAEQSSLCIHHVQSHCNDAPNHWDTHGIPHHDVHVPAVLLCLQEMASMVLWMQTG